MNTFERHFQKFPEFIRRVREWEPDFIVPVAKKGCKLLRASNPALKVDRENLKYRVFFELHASRLDGKKIAVVDDATQYTSTLQEYRRYFERRGATVSTFSFVGHEKLHEGARWKYDERAQIEIYLPDPVYQEYILQQAYYLLDFGSHFDLDHLIFEIKLSPSELEAFMASLRPLGVVLPLEDYFLDKGLVRFSLNDVSFFSSLPYFRHPAVHRGAITKIKFVYNPAKNCLLFSPLVFPTWKYSMGTIGPNELENTPFCLPFEAANNFNKRDRSTILRIYADIYYLYTMSLAKAFVQQLQERWNHLALPLSLRRDDLDAMFAKDEADRMISSLQREVASSKQYDFSLPENTESRVVGIEAKTFGEFIDQLREGYKRTVRRQRTRIGVHYFVSYDRLFASKIDKLELWESLDYYCDFGAIVPDTIASRGAIFRACRTGEPNTELNWMRTRVLVPMAIEQCRIALKRNDPTVEPMLLMKVLANFAYDYPSGTNHELHCLIGEPYTLGTMVKCYHHHKAPSKPTLYETHRISPYYSWDRSKHVFRLERKSSMLREIKNAFDERQEVPYSEIVTYFRLLAAVYQSFRRVDVLNALSICREENYFYSHVLYNARTWIEEFSVYLADIHHVAAKKHLHQSGTQAQSASNKLQMAFQIDTYRDQVKTTFGNEVEYAMALETLSRNSIPFSSRILATLEDLQMVVRLMSFLTNYSLYYHARENKYLLAFRRTAAMVTASADVSMPVAQNALSSEDGYLELLSRVYGQVLTRMDGLRDEEPLLATRLQNEGLLRGRNVATRYVYKAGLEEVVLLYLDFSGLRSIPEPKETVMGRYYQLVDKHWDKRSGVRLYGGRGGDDAYTILFTSLKPALQCAFDIKQEFGQDMFLCRSGDVKFGLSYALLGADKEATLIRAWGEAKDCCEYKNPTYRNRGHLLISGSTMEIIMSKNPEIAKQFATVVGKSAKQELQSGIYRFTDIVSL